MKTPENYRQYITGNNPMTGELSIDPGWFQLWPHEQVEELNREYGVQESLPGFYGFGSDGGGELFAFNPDGQVFMIPFIPMDPEEAVKISESWTEFEKAIQK